jgi:hypothetical protein
MNPLLLRVDDGELALRLWRSLDRSLGNTPESGLVV